MRGIAFYQDNIIAAASNEIFFLDQEFKIIETYQNTYLKHCHEIFVDQDILYLSSTGFDSLLLFDLISKKFVGAFCYRSILSEQSFMKKALKRMGFRGKKTQFYKYNPIGKTGPVQGDTNHINNVYCRNEDIFFSGSLMNLFLKIDTNAKITNVMNVPGQTHNIQYFHDDILFNDTGSDRICLCKKTGKPIRIFQVQRYDVTDLVNTDISSDHARQAFARGLCTYDDYIIGGSSPSTISVYQAGQERAIKIINLTKDIRNAIHGLEVYPYKLQSNIFPE